ncbi:hypothetical protein PHLGIDRAFT_456221 [Phlebiopsis gigantea 11061_1 CR5-6]|uniref:Uncharacterized protein n=1 Tax=Phlebiopsis gigantea (strain 11061_1 CR5-6) TaxID=745531 RepID=A0A0C3P186_PHLG1|nr:hypothetical protein PHLGIDRAFT_456221 [Phlebiopsis gigantea 11061_1 CR5-6]
MSVQVPGPVPSSTGKARGRPRKHAVTKDEDTKPSRRSSKEFRETAEAGSSSAQVSAVGPPRQAKKLLQKGKRGSKPGPIPSPPASSQASPPPSATQTQQVENTHGNVLNGLRELWSVGRESVIPDSELAQALFERREGMRVLRDEGKITEADYTKVSTALSETLDAAHHFHFSSRYSRLDKVEDGTTSTPNAVSSVLTGDSHSAADILDILQGMY